MAKEFSVAKFSETAYPSPDKYMIDGIPVTREVFFLEMIMENLQVEIPMIHQKLNSIAERLKVLGI